MLHRRKYFECVKILLFFYILVYEQYTPCPSMHVCDQLALRDLRTKVDARIFVKTNLEISESVDKMHCHSSSLSPPHFLSTYLEFISFFFFSFFCANMAHVLNVL